MDALHLAGNAIDVYDRVEAYEVCGEELREAYVGLKRLCKVWQVHWPSGADAAEFGHYSGGDKWGGVRVSGAQISLRSSLRLLWHL